MSEQPHTNPAVPGTGAATLTAGDRAGDPPAPSPELIELAHAYGVATEFWDWRGRHTTVSRYTVLAVLAALGVDATSEPAVHSALADVRERPWRRVLPDVLVIREGATTRVPVHVDHGSPVEVWVELEGGDRRPLAQEDRWVDPRLVGGRLVGEASFLLPERPAAGLAPAARPAQRGERPTGRWW